MTTLPLYPFVCPGKETLGQTVRLASGQQQLPQGEQLALQQQEGLRVRQEPEEEVVLVLVINYRLKKYICILDLKYLADPGEARGCSSNTLVIHSPIKISFHYRHAQTVENCASIHKLDCLDIFSEILNL